MTVLALPKICYEIRYSSGKKDTVMCDKEVDRQDIISKKRVVVFDNNTINGSYISNTKKIDVRNETADSAQAYALSISYGPLRAVAIERVRNYEVSVGQRMPIDKITRRINNFNENRENLEENDKFVQLYLSSGGERKK